MQPKTYTVDTQRYRNRLIQWVQNVVLGAVFALVGVLAGDFAFITRFGAAWALPGLAYAAFSMVMVVRIARFLNAARHRLLVRSEGMVLVRHGQTSRWRWPEISHLRLENRFASFTAESAGQRTDHRIDDIYLTPLTQIVAHVNAARDTAIATNAAPETPTAESAPTTPTLFTIAASTEFRRQWTQAGWLLLAILLGSAVFLALGEKQFARFVFALKNTPMAVYALAGVFLVFTSGMAIAATRRFGNFLQITEEGLTWSWRLTVIRQWRWQDLSPFEIRDHNGSGSPDGRGIAFMAADDGKPFSNMGLSTLFLARPASMDPTSFTIDETYEAPLEQIAAELNASRDRALALEPPPRTIELPASGTAGVPGQPVNFQLGAAHARKMGVVAWTLAFGTLVWLPVIFLLGWPFDVPGGMVGWAQSPGQWLLRFLSFLPLIAIIAELLILVRELVPADNMISLDRYGLKLTRGGREKLWAWRDLSAFQVEACRVLGLFGPRGVIVFGAPGGRDLRSRFLRLCYRLTGRAPAIVIEDVYDTPLRDIAATLNRYRSASGGGTVPAE